MGIPSGAASYFVSSLRGRVVTRMGIVFLAPVVMLGPLLVGLVLNIPGLSEPLHPFNPATALGALMDSREMSTLLRLALTAMTLLALALNTPRMVRGVREVLAASAERRAKPADRA
jgi:hypothetical protein